MEEIARAAGVHRTTVSMALRNHPKLPAATRERIQQIAREMGYTPNPLVSALMHYRAGRRSPGAQGEIAYFVNEEREEQWRKPLSYRKIFAGAEARARELGFRLEVVWLQQPGLTERALNRMLRARNIHAAIVAPRTSQLHTIASVDWSRLSAVAIGYSLEKPALHRVAHDYFHSAMTVAREGMALGYRRIGFALEQKSDVRVEHRWVGGWRAIQALPEGAALLPPLLLRQTAQGTVDEQALREYLETHRPNAFCGLPGLKYEHLRRWTKRFPCPVRISLGCYEPTPGQLGIYQNYERIGAVAVDQVVAMLMRSERGVPEQALDTLLKGIWLGAKRG